jgi:mannitol operon repressor
MGITQLMPLQADEDTDDELFQLQMQRQRQMIKSGLSLAIVDICNQLDKESPL